MSCVYFTKRTRKYKPYFFCRLSKKVITFDDCKNCLEAKYKEIKPIKKRTNKQAKLEKGRYSIITNDLEHCYICAERGIKNVPKKDLHEVYGGSNRKRSIENGLVVPLCRKCHEDYEIIKYLKRFVQLEYEENHSRDDFINLIGKSYL